jgi:hypothetical protein
MKMSVAKCKKSGLFLFLLALGTIMILADKGEAYRQSRARTHHQSKRPGQVVIAGDATLPLLILLDNYLADYITQRTF